MKDGTTMGVEAPRLPEVRDYFRVARKSAQRFTISGKIGDFPYFGEAIMK